MGNKARFHADIMAMHPTVTGSCNLVIVKPPDRSTIRFVVDCGMFQERKYNELNETLPFYSEHVDFCLVTHNHVDHVGRLPFMVKNGFRNPIYMTETTSKLIPFALFDSCKVLNDLAKRNNSKRIYDESNVSKTLQLVQPCKYFEPIQVHPNVVATFFPNGHLVGAALILVQISYPGYDDINILFTGDYNNKNIFFDVPPLPQWVLELPLTVIQESTYGNMDSTEVTETFKQNVINCVNNNGTTVAMVFSLGRSQEILYTLKKMQESGDLSLDVPIYFDGKLAFKYTSLYLHDGLDNRPEMKNFLPENLTYVDSSSRPDIVESTARKIIVTTSGMGSYGPAQTYIPEYLSRENALIQFTGFTTPLTLGARLKDTESGNSVEVGGLIARKRAKVEYSTEYSAHAKADEMIAFLQQFKNLRLVLVNHGEEDVKKIFAERITNEVQARHVGLLGREYFFRVNHYGLVKTLSTKFD